MWVEGPGGTVSPPTCATLCSRVLAALRAPAFRQNRVDTRRPPWYFLATSLGFPVSEKRSGAAKVTQDYR